MENRNPTMPIMDDEFPLLRDDINDVAQVNFYDFVLTSGNDEENVSYEQFQQPIGAFEETFQTHPGSFPSSADSGLLLPAGELGSQQYGESLALPIPFTGFQAAMETLNEVPMPLFGFGQIGNFVSSPQYDLSPSIMPYDGAIGGDEDANHEGIDEEDSDAQDKTFSCSWIDTPDAPELCGSIFVQEEALDTHLKQVHCQSASESFICLWRLCKRELEPFPGKAKLERHMSTHSQYKAFPCTSIGCDSRLATSQSLAQHLRSHLGLKPHGCSECNSHFNNRASLALHGRMHTGEKPLKCKYPKCPRSFAESSNLSKHMKTHSLIGAFQCAGYIEVVEGCRKTFHRKTQLRKHYVSHVKKGELSENFNYMRWLKPVKP